MRKRILALAFCLLLLCGGVTASAAGSASDPLVSQSYADSWADSLVRDFGLSFRESHRLTARLVRYLNSLGDYEGAGMTSEALEEMALETLGKPLTLSAERLKQVLSPEYFVSIRGITGGPAIEQMERMIRERADLYETAQALEEKLLEAKHQLDADIADLLNP